jgi:hypothetical protein
MKSRSLAPDPLPGAPSLSSSLSLSLSLSDTRIGTRERSLFSCGRESSGRRSEKEQEGGKEGENRIKRPFLPVILSPRPPLRESTSWRARAVKRKSVKLPVGN